MFVLYMFMVYYSLMNPLYIQKCYILIENKEHYTEKSAASHFTLILLQCAPMRWVQLICLQLIRVLIAPWAAPPSSSSDKQISPSFEAAAKISSTASGHSAHNFKDETKLKLAAKNITEIKFVAEINIKFWIKKTCDELIKYKYKIQNF